MNKVAQYLQEHLAGEVSVSPEVRRHFSHDASILKMIPAMVVYPRTEEDIRKAARFSWQLAERGRILPITARGGGSDTSGAAITNGVLLVTTAHMNRVLALDPKKNFVSVEPGATYDKLEQTLYTHGLFLPVYPASAAYATIGGGLAGNAVGEKTIKYGGTLKYVQNLRVVLANGEVIETGRLNKRELNRKLGLTTFEGQIYRELDALLEERASTIGQYRSSKKVAYDSAGYNLASVRTKDGFDLTPLFVGSQGSLGIITEATLSLAPHNPATTLMMISLPTLNDLADILPEIIKLKPSVLDMVNKKTLEEVNRVNPKVLGGGANLGSAVHLFVEFDDHREGAQKKNAKHLAALAEKYNGFYQSSDRPEDHHNLLKIRQSVSTILGQPYGSRRAVPVAEDIIIPVENLVDFIKLVEKLFSQANLPAIIWGQAGSGIIRLHPILDVAQLGDRQKLFKISDALYSAALKLGGSMSASAGDGRVRAPYLRAALGDEMYRLTMAVKKIFDPHNILNTGVKTAPSDQVKALIRDEYSLGHHENLPRS